MAVNLGLLLIYSFPLALIAMTIALIILLITTIIGLLIYRKLSLFQQLSGELLEVTVQLIAGVSKLRVAAVESDALAYWAQKYTQQVKLILSSQFLEDILTVFNVGSRFSFQISPFNDQFPSGLLDLLS
jgi:ATP-binding cassette subfamily C protein